MATFHPKSWGHEDWIVNTPDYCGKTLFVKQQHRSSIHSHKIKDETLCVREGLVWFETGSEPTSLTGVWMRYNDRIRITPGIWHRFTAMQDSEIVEVSTHHEESDSIRHITGGRMSDDEYHSLYMGFIQYESRDIVLPPAVASAVSGQLREEGRRIGLCNGCFDLMHLGHQELLRQAKMRCEVLFVAVNSDASIKQLKTEARPFVDERGRVGMVAASRFVDYVVVSTKATCVDIVKQINPDVYITTAEYGNTGPEAKEVIASGAIVEVVPLIEGYNTTRIARKIQGR